MGELTSKQFWADAAVRAIRTMAQTAVGVIGTAAADTVAAHHGSL